MKSVLRAWLRRAGWTVHRWPANRFDAMDDTLRLLHRRGFAPTVVIDVGANVGQWTDLAMRVFSAREYHLIEPLPGCAGALRRFAPPRCTVHPVALTADGVTMVRMHGSGTGRSGTGAWIDATGSSSIESVQVSASGLDRLLADRLAHGDRVLLKLDVEGHELTVLGAGDRVLAASEVVVLEFSVYHVEQQGQPVLLDVMNFMRTRGFEFYDVAQLARRPRDFRLRSGDAVFVRSDSPLALDTQWW